MVTFLTPLTPGKPQGFGPLVSRLPRVRCVDPKANEGDAAAAVCQAARVALEIPTRIRDHGGQIESTQAESQWIVGQSLLSALTIPGGN